MFNPLKAPKHHKFQYHPRNYEKTQDKLRKRKDSLIIKREDKDFDVLTSYRKKKQENTFRMDLIVLGIIFFLHLIFINQIIDFFETKYKYGELTAYFSLVLQGFIFIKRSKRNNV